MARATPWLQAWPILVLLAGVVHAARPPDSDRATSLVEEFTERAASESLDAVWLREVVRPLALAELPPSARRSYYHHLERALDRDSNLGRTLGQAPEVLGVVDGPDYVRVVLDTSPALTAVIRKDASGVFVERFERSACGLCSEQERFVADLLDELASGEGKPRLLPGVDLHVDAAAQASVPTDWVYAWHARNVDAGYLRWLARDAEVISGDALGVDVALVGRTETWPVVYTDGRWQLDYAELDADSPVRLADEGLATWREDRVIARHSVEWWIPARDERELGLLLATDVRLVAPRPLQGDLLLYVQDLERSFALAALIDPSTGEVERRIGLPTLSKRENHDPDTWADLFVGALSPDGKTLAIGAHRRLWIVDLESGDVLRTVYDLNGLRALSWSPDGARLAVGDERGVSLLDGARFGDRARHWAETLSPVEGLVYEDDRVWMLQEDGLLTPLSVPKLLPSEGGISACCGEVRGVTTLAHSGEILVGCAGTCDPAWLWRWEPGGEALVLADQDWRGQRGTVGASPDGRYLVSPTADARAALWDLREGEVVAVFGPSPLEQVSWDSDRIYALDTRSRAWSWELSELVP